MSLGNDFLVPGDCDFRVPSKPRKPLSAYNLFFRFERSRILRASELDCISFLKGQDGTLRIVRNKNSKIDFPDISSFPIDIIRDQIKKESTRRTKRKNKRAHGKISFTDMIQYMCKNWNNLDTKTRILFNTLAAEEKEKYAKQLMAYNKARYDSVKDIIGADYGSGEHYDAPVINQASNTSTSTADESDPHFSLESKIKVEETKSFDEMYYKCDETVNSKFGDSNKNYPNWFLNSRIFQVNQQKEKMPIKDNLYVNHVKISTSPRVLFDQTMTELEKIFRQRPIIVQSSLSLENKLEYSLKYHEEKDLAHFLSEFDWQTF